MDRLYTNQYNPTRSSDTQLLNLNYSKEFLNESRFLDFEDSYLLSKIRMGYMQQPYDQSWGHPQCDCDPHDPPLLTVMHFLLECKKDDLEVKRRVSI